MVAQAETFAADTFNEYRPLLFAIAFRMLGSWMDAEDVVQEAFLRWSQIEPGTIASPKSYLSAIATRLSIDQLRSARVQREQYVGPWLPEQTVIEDTRLGPDPVVLSESLSQAFLVVLETLTPVERAVFLLHEVFDYPFEEIAGIIGKNPANTRQIAHRARQHVDERRPRYEASPAQQEELLRAFIAAATAGDVPALTELLAEDAVLWTDGGGKRQAALRPIVGRDQISRGASGAFAKYRGPMAIYLTRLTGQPAGVILRPDGVFGTLTIEVTDGRISALRSVVNPDKLHGLELDWPARIAAGEATLLGKFD